jgi:hypothetical protein
MAYDSPKPDYGDLMTREDFLADVASHFLMDYDGSGYAARADGTMDRSLVVIPSQAATLDPAVTHVVWFNR